MCVCVCVCVREREREKERERERERERELSVRTLLLALLRPLCVVGVYVLPSRVANMLFASDECARCVCDESTCATGEQRE